MPYNRDKGKGKQREFTPRLRCFICDGPHLERECPKREALNKLIKKGENEEKAHLSSMQMLGAIQFMSKASLQGSKVGEQVKVGSPRGDRILKGKEKSVGQRGQHSNPQKDGYQ